jgi:hypothetical protein
MNNEYYSMPVSILVDMLAQETEKITHLMALKDMGEEYERVKQNIKSITSAIESKKSSILPERDHRMRKADPSS